MAKFSIDSLLSKSELASLRSAPAVDHSRIRTSIKVEAELGPDSSVVDVKGLPVATSNFLNSLLSSTGLPTEYGIHAPMLSLSTLAGGGPTAFIPVTPSFFGKHKHYSSHPRV